MRKIWKMILVFVLIVVIGIFVWINVHETTKVSDTFNNLEADTLKESNIQEELKNSVEEEVTVPETQKEEVTSSDGNEKKIETETYSEYSQEETTFSQNMETSKSIETTEDSEYSNDVSETKQVLKEDNEMEIPWEWIE